MTPALWAASVFSGLAALVYQVLWSRELSLVLGTSTEAVSIVLSSFMAGLGLGNALAARVLGTRGSSGPPPQRLARAYAGLEAVVAAGGLVLPFAFTHATGWLAPLYADGSSPLTFRLARAGLAFVLLAAPTTAMGATLPLLIALARPTTSRVAAATGSLYAANTVGAVLGALLTPLALLPSLGMERTRLVAVAANAVAGLVVLRSPFARAAGVDRADPSAAGPTDPGAARAATRLVLIVSLLSGLGALAHEVAWTRALVLLIGPTAYAFAFVVASVIAGLAVGSGLASRFADGLRRPALALAVAQAGIVAWALLLVPLVGFLPLPIGNAARALQGQPMRLLAWEGGATLVLLLVPSALFGASFPLAARLVAAAGSPPGAAAGRVLAWNTAGALVGPLLAGFVLLPLLGLQWTLLGAAAIHGVAALMALAAEAPATAGRRTLIPGVMLLVPIVALAFVPRWDLERLAGGAYRYGHREAEGELEESLRAGELLYYRDGTLATVSVKRLGNAKALAVDGKVDATNGGDMATQRLLAHLPLLLHGAARRVAVVGLGSGATAASALKHPLEALDVIEISPEVVEAARSYFGDVNAGVFTDPRVRLRVTDARNHLLLTPGLFDVIISEPSNPWMAGVASLFTREFFASARARLSPGGLFGQWMHVYGMTVDDFRTVVGGFADVFPESGLFQITEGDLLLVGAEGRWPQPSAAALAERMALPAVAEDLRGIGVTRVGTLATLYTLGPGRLAALAGDAERHTDDRPVLELRAARAMLANTAGANRRAIVDAARGMAPVEPWASLTASLDAEDLVEHGRLLERSTSLSLALEAYGTALRMDPRNAKAQEGLVRIGATSDALSAVENVLKQLVAGPDPLGARVSLAKLYRALGRTEEAGRELMAVLTADPSNVRALKVAAAIQGELRQAGAVDVLAGRAFHLAPNDAEAAALVASGSLLAGETEEARAAAEVALRLDPTLELALRVKALALVGLGRKAEARTAFDALVERQGGSWQAWVYYGAFLADTGDWTAAARAFESGADLAPDSREAFGGLLRAGQALDDRQRITRAEAALRRLGPQSP
jgi:spermidine synthase